jgi:hypothetical protein
MTMRIVILKPIEKLGVLPGEEHFIHRVQALQMIDDGLAAIPAVYKDMLEKAKADELEAKEKAAEAKAIADEKEEAKRKAEELRKADLLRKKKEQEKTAVSKKASTRSRAVKK